MTNSWLLVCLCAAACSVCLVGSLPSQHHRLQKRGNVKLCGKHLVEALALICQNRYYAPLKRNELDAVENENDHETNEIVDPWWYSFVESESNPDVKDHFLEPKTALNFFGKRDSYLRVTRGVSDECCKKSCSMDELSAYCGQKKRSPSYINSNHP